MSFRQIGNPGVQFKAKGPAGILGPVYYTSQPLEADGSSVSPPLNRLQCNIWHVPRNLVISQIGLYIDIPKAAALYRLGVYASDEYPLPDRLLLDAGTLACNAPAGYRFLTLPVGLPLTAGQIVYLAACPQVGAVANVRKGGISGNFNPMWTYSIHPGLLDATGPVGTVCYSRTGIAGALPDTFLTGAPPGTIARQDVTPLVLVAVNTGGS